ncbi:cytochrome b/b6 domain-containing protein [Glaciecola petra]|uniref:Cytochrome b/b6 domain-containing protein n=1 Tax=Glaciecola petra TaxID=3075602 RepID=A0ABU2ZNQ3_9ALTE|nr:cytochrome b/b6 domain-containing protein [Aestuariibacter sp. P117]MDT0593979.1 cytochrome b/b6 domain-containing protein [Aestuariibacter sp. P117]
MQKIKVWDLPIRLFHWLLVLAIVFQFVTGDLLDDAMQLHFYGGYTIIGLIIFRLLWGMLGTYYARFNQFIVSPVSAFKYLTKANNIVYLGHNPAGAYSVVLLLSLIFTQAISGLFISDEIFTDGPYYGLLNEFWQSLANFIHHNFMNVIFAAIALHVGAIIFYKIKYKEGLTSAMITGFKQVDTTNLNKPKQTFPYFSFILSIVITMSILYLLIEVLPPPPADDYFGY